MMNVQKESTKLKMEKKETCDFGFILIECLDGSCLVKTEYAEIVGPSLVALFCAAILADQHSPDISKIIR
jgi:hypothetical protein